MHSEVREIFRMDAMMQMITCKCAAPYRIDPDAGRCHALSRVKEDAVASTQDEVDAQKRPRTRAMSLFPECSRMRIAGPSTEDAPAFSVQFDNRSRRK